ncbi:DNA cytosine methyltransferase [uncultured Selenomonas sp.]|uniref:DNA cytosine methyltransferase n=1 Tax=uncultured Selenomonas sp. TaxID=159275 RepID=UPI0025E4A5C2|nr:DNA cytosine methyltransferase [uncultured Selenomonas sp.]
MIRTVGSICSGIEAASVAWQPLGLLFQWFSEIAPFPARVLREHYPETPNLGDMNEIPALLEAGKVVAPDMICGGTPCQAFSLAGWQNGLHDERGNLTLKFVDIIEANDRARARAGQPPCVVFWENVEGVLKDKTNAFGCLVSSLAGLDGVLETKRWPNAGMIAGRRRNVAWRVLDAKYFGLPQQRRRLYVVAGDREFHPEAVLFERHQGELATFPSAPLTFEKDGHAFEVFRAYADCLYSAYGTKWNGNAAAYNGSLFVKQDGRLRRLSPLECERLMGFPDGYTSLERATRTNRYQAIGNSWAVPVVRWIGERIVDVAGCSAALEGFEEVLQSYARKVSGDEAFFDFGDGIFEVGGRSWNCSEVPERCVFRTMEDIIAADAPESIYISPVGCAGILRRSEERRIAVQPRLARALRDIAAQMPAHEIERRSRVQHRGRFSRSVEMLAGSPAASSGVAI